VLAKYFILPNIGVSFFCKTHLFLIIKRQLLTIDSKSGTKIVTIFDYAKKNEKKQTKKRK
jgi:hypothetical protein